MNPLAIGRHKMRAAARDALTSLASDKSVSNVGLTNRRRMDAGARTRRLPSYFFVSRLQLTENVFTLLPVYLSPNSTSISHLAAVNSIIHLEDSRIETAQGETAPRETAHV